MIYILPSWFSDGSKPSDFDDTVNQCRIFNKSKTDIELLLTDYLPGIHLFLQQQGLLKTARWSLYDHLQGIDQDFFRSLSFDDFSWPQGIEKIYTPFNIVVLKNDERIGQVSFYDNGLISKVERFKSGQKDVDYIIDDRGFVSSKIFYLNEKAQKQIFLDLEGRPIFSQELSGSNAVNITPDFSDRFGKPSYNNFQELANEFVTVHLKNARPSDDVLLVASDIKNERLAFSQKDKAKIILSFFADRYDFTKVLPKTFFQRLDQASVIIVDRQQLADKMLSLIKKTAPPNDIDKIAAKIQQLPPFDTRLELGTSQREDKLIIFWLLGNSDFNKMTDLFLDKMIKNPKINLIIDLSPLQNARVFEISLLNLINKKMSTNLTIDYLDQRNQENENQLPDLESQETDDRASQAAEDLFDRVEFCILQGEKELVSKIRNVRLIVDLQREANVFLQLAAISSGIPQINAGGSLYVEDHKNGLIVKEPKDLDKAIDFYFKGLKNWNQALVYSVQKMDQYSDFSLIQKWFDLIKKS